MNILTELEIKLGASIGSGGFGDVYESYDPQLDCELAIKKIPLSKFSSPQDYFKEAAILYESRHTNVVEVMYSTKDKDHIYLAMPLMQGGSLEERLKNKSFTLRETARFGLSFLAGLNHVHSRGLIHFDIKPGNVLLTSSGRAAISDFGISKYLDPSLGTADNAYGTRCFAPPEAFQTTQHTVSYDIYQAGHLLYQMLVGGPEWARQVNLYPTNADLEGAIAAGEFPDRTRLPEHVPSALKNLILSCLSTDPAERPTSVLSIVNGLAAVDVRLDWRHTVTTRGGEEWLLEGEKPGAKVTIEPDTNGRWRVESFKSRGGKTVKKANSNDNGLTRLQAARKAQQQMNNLE